MFYKETLLLIMFKENYNYMLDSCGGYVEILTKGLYMYTNFKNWEKNIYILYINDPK